MRCVLPAEGKVAPAASQPDPCLSAEQQSALAKGAGIGIETGFQRELRREIVELLESGQKKEVYRLSVQLFPLSRRNLGETK